MIEPHRETLVLKVGGSLLDMPDLASRVQNVLARFSAPRVLLFPGGGSTADVVRDLDRIHLLGEETSHWLAIRSLSLNAHFLGALFRLPVVEKPSRELPVAIVDPFAWAMLDEDTAEHCPHRWDVTSDSLALRFAQAIQARQLILLKSVSLPADTSWSQASHLGRVDAFFPTLASRSPGMKIDWLNLRQPVETWPAIH